MDLYQPLPLIRLPAPWRPAAALRWSLWPGLVLITWLLPPNVAVLLVVAPLLEELLFRGGVQEVLLRRGVRPLAANLVATLAFAVSHGVMRSWPLAVAVVLPSIALGLVYQRNRRVTPVVALHSAMNLLWVAISLVSPDLSNFFH